MFIDIYVPRQRWRQGLAGVVSVPLTGGPFGASFRDLGGQIAQFLILGSLQSAYLTFERAYARDLADAGRDAEAQQVARDIESACGEVSFVCFRLHLIRSWQTVCQMVENLRVNFV